MAVSAALVIAVLVVVNADAALTWLADTVDRLRPIISLLQGLGGDG